MKWKHRKFGRVDTPPFFVIPKLSGRHFRCVWDTNAMSIQLIREERPKFFDSPEDQENYQSRNETCQSHRSNIHEESCFSKDITKGKST